MRVSRPAVFARLSLLTLRRIVEYATRDQAQQAVSTLSNQNLMGRLVYVREVSLRILPKHQRPTLSGREPARTLSC